jgi:Peptidase family M28
MNASEDFSSLRAGRPEVYNPGVGGSKRSTAVVLSVFLAVIAAVAWRSQGPSPKGLKAPGNEFSAARAARALRDALGGNVPHPLGSAAHEAVRERLAIRLRTLGYDVLYQRTFACGGAGGVCAPLVNLIARAPGQSPGDTLIVAAHYDSVPAGPGASDDGLGVATTLEVARAIRAEHLHNNVELVITDGEEAGLLGAEGFVADHDAPRGVVAVINTEARGTTGRSYMFETSRNNRWLIPIVARALPRPATSSLYFNIYELLPNDTDMTVFKRAGIAGLNFANIGRVVHYHTPLDSLDNLSLTLLQDDGDHVLAMTRALGNAELRQVSDQNAAWFDVLSFFLIWWPQGLTVWLTLFAFVMIVVGAALRIREDETTSRAITFGVLAWLGSVFAALLITVILNWIIGLRAAGATWVAQPVPAILSMGFAGFGIAMAITAKLWRRAGFDGLFLGGALCWAATSVVLLVLLPGGSYLALVPALALGICALLRSIIDLDETIIAVIGCLVTGVLLLPVAASFYDALGRPVLPAIAALVALVTTTVAMVVRRGGGVALAASAILALVAIALPPYTAESPRRLSLQYVDNDGAKTWQADSLSPALRAVAGFASEPKAIAPWARSPVRTYVAPAPDAALPPIELHTVTDERHGAQRTLVLALHSPRGAPRIALILHAPGLLSLRVNGVVPPPPSTRVREFLADGWRRISVRGASDAVIEVVLRDGAAIDAIAIDTSYGLPAAGAALASARNASLAVPSDDGDVSTTMRRMRF